MIAEMGTDRASATNQRRRANRGRTAGYRPKLPGTPVQAAAAQSAKARLAEALREKAGVQEQLGAVNDQLERFLRK